MKRRRALAPLVLALTALASCVGSQSCIDIAGCEINIGSVGATVSVTGRDGPTSLEDLAHEIVYGRR